MKVTIPQLLNMKKNREKITMITAYDYPTAILVDQAGIDAVLIGDSVGMVMLGYSSTLPVTMRDMLHHVKAVVKGIKRAFIVGDMPFMSYSSIRDAVRNAGLLMRAGCDAVKVEGGAEIVEIVRAIVNAGIPVMGHIGLTPQRYALLGGYRVQGRDVESAERVIRDAEALEKAGVFAVVLELVASEVAKVITEKLSIPTIGVGSGPYCDGQVLVVTDILGLTMWMEKPKFIKQYINLSEVILNVLKSYSEDVKSGRFPTDEHSYHMDNEEFRKFQSKHSP
ncbi:MAG: 3-methyl-2-oxobutanoate hydroxymethyltransferase [Candidatus Methanomethylicia archaeon]